MPSLPQRTTFVPESGRSNHGCVSTGHFHLFLQVMAPFRKKGLDLWHCMAFDLNHGY